MKLFTWIGSYTQMIRYQFLFLLLCASSVFGKIRVLTFHYNHPEFIELQHKAFSRFMQEPYELIVFNDACQPEEEEAIQTKCHALHIQCVRYQQEWHLTRPESIVLNNRVEILRANPEIRHFFSIDPSVGNHRSIRHQHVIQYALDYFGYDHDDIVVIMDGDAFPIRPLNLHAMMFVCDIIGTLPCMHHLHEPTWPPDSPSYLWVPFVAINMPNLVDKRDLHFSSDVINGILCDTGAESFYYLTKHPELLYEAHRVNSSEPVANLIRAGTSFDYLKKKFGLWDRELRFISKLPSNVRVQLMINNQILHFSAGSFSLAGEKITVVTDFIHQICD